MNRTNATYATHASHVTYAAPRLRWLRPVVAATLASAAAVAFAAPTERIEKLNRAFLEHLGTLGAAQAQPVEHLRKIYPQDYRDTPESFVPDALALLYPAFRDVLTAFDEERFDDVVKLADRLRENKDEFLAANADYYYARALIERGRQEEALKALAAGAAAERKLDERTPYAAHLLFLKGFAQAGTLDFEAAVHTLGDVLGKYPDAPEAVRVGARELKLELERREPQSLDEVDRLMAYAASRLKIGDAADKTQQRQDEAIKLLDKLIEDQEQKEKQNGGGSCNGKNAGGGGKGGKKGNATKQPKAPAEESRAPEGAGSIGELHSSPKAEPAAMWGKLPPAERERILQSLHDRFPSRYRQLVEQYYRALAEEK